MSHSPKSAERRWIILAQDGRHVTMGRAAPPSEAEVAAAAAALAAQGLAGWLATLDGNYWSHRRVALARGRGQRVEGVHTTRVNAGVETEEV